MDIVNCFCMRGQLNRCTARLKWVRTQQGADHLQVTVQKVVEDTYNDTSERFLSVTRRVHGKDVVC